MEMALGPAPQQRGLGFGDLFYEPMSEEVCALLVIEPRNIAATGRSGATALIVILESALLIFYNEERNVRA